MGYTAALVTPTSHADEAGSLLFLQRQWPSRPTIPRMLPPEVPYRSACALLGIFCTASHTAPANMSQAGRHDTVTMARTTRRQHKRCKRSLARGAINMAIFTLSKGWSMAVICAAVDVTPELPTCTAGPPPSNPATIAMIALCCFNLTFLIFNFFKSGCGAALRSRPLVRLHRPLPIPYLRIRVSVAKSHTIGDATLVQGSFGTWYIPSTSMVDSVTGLRYAEFPVPPIMPLVLT